MKGKDVKKSITQKIILSFTGLFLTLLTFTSSPLLAETSPSMHQHHHAVTPEESPSPKLDGRSIYHLNSIWKNQNNEDTALASLKTQPLVLAMLYTSCQYVCPMIVSDMKKIEKGLLPEQLKKTRFVIVSIDPERDTPKQLKSFAAKRSLDESRWILLSGKADDILTLANVLGVKYKKETSGDFSHSSIIHIIDAGGVLRHQQFGNNVAPDESLKLLKGLF